MLILEKKTMDADSKTSDISHVHCKQSARVLNGFYIKFPQGKVTFVIKFPAFSYFLLSCV